MNLWSRIKAVLSFTFLPDRFAQRVATSRPAVFNNLFGIGSSGAGSTGAKWPGGLSNSGTAPILHHHLLRRQARSAYHTSLQARSIVERHTDSVVDVGLKVDATPDVAILGITDEQGEQWAQDVNVRFDHWARNRKATIAENMNFYQSQRMVGISQQRDGEYFVRFMYSLRSDLLNPLQLSFLDPSQIDGIGLTNTYGFNQWINDGIERDNNGKEIAYNVIVKKPEFSTKSIRIPAMGARSKRRMMIHGYQPEYAGQGRGFPRLSHALQELENITDYAASELKKAINQSTITAFVKPSKDNPSSNPFEGVSQNAPVGPAGLSAQAQDLAAENNLDTGPVVNYIPVQEATNAVPGSLAICNLNEGEEIKPFQSTSPVEGFEKFVNAVASHLSASLSIPLEVVLMRFNQNYSASRAALILFWRVAQIWRDEMASDFLNPVYEAWLSGEIAAGRVQAPGFSDPRLREAWLKNTWIGAPLPNIDPMRTAKADQLYAEMGAQDLDRVSQQLNGSSGKANRAKLRRQAGELPLLPWSGDTTVEKSDGDGGNPDPDGDGDEGE
jgi:lambda family phage portal protein